MQNGAIPGEANGDYPGPQSELAGKGRSNQLISPAPRPKFTDPDLVGIAKRMATVKHKILVLSGEDGGVGKSAFSSQLSLALSAIDFQVGLLDSDICRPSIPKILGLEGQEIHQTTLGWSPVYFDSNLGVMSVGFMVTNPDDAVMCTGAVKISIIKQILENVCWYELDFLVVDAPPGISDEHIFIVQFLQESGGIDGAIIVTPQQVDVTKEVNFCKKAGIQIIGVVDNTSTPEVNGIINKVVRFWKE